MGCMPKNSYNWVIIKEGRSTRRVMMMIMMETMLTVMMIPKSVLVWQLYKPKLKANIINKT